MYREKPYLYSNIMYEGETQTLDIFLREVLKVKLQNRLGSGK